MQTYIYKNNNIIYDSDSDIPFEIASNNKYLNMDTFNDDDCDDDNIIITYKFKNTFTKINQIETLKKYHLDTEKNILKLEDEIKFLEFNIFEKIKCMFKCTYRIFLNFDILERFPDDIRFLIYDYYDFSGMIKERMLYENSLKMKKRKIEFQKKEKRKNLKEIMKCIALFFFFFFLFGTDILHILHCQKLHKEKYGAACEFGWCPQIQEVMYSNRCFECSSYGIKSFIKKE